MDTRPLLSAKLAMMVIAAEAVVTYGGQTDRDVRELRLIWVKQQGKWLISKVELKETIRRPPGLGERISKVQPAYSFRSDIARLKSLAVLTLMFIRPDGTSRTSPPTSSTAAESSSTVSFFLLANS